jgi:fluoride exporter
MTKYLLVGVGGCLGSILRFWIAEYVGTRMGARFPYGTFIVNCTACFLIGLSVTILAEKANWGANWRYLIPIGFIGGYSTFSREASQDLAQIIACIRSGLWRSPKIFR